MNLVLIISLIFLFISIGTILRNKILREKWIPIISFIGLLSLFVFVFYNLWFYPLTVREIFLSILTTIICNSFSKKDKS